MKGTSLGDETHSTAARKRGVGSYAGEGGVSNREKPSVKSTRMVAVLLLRTCTISGIMQFSHGQFFEQKKCYFHNTSLETEISQVLSIVALHEYDCVVPFPRASRSSTLYLVLLT